MTNGTAFITGASSGIGAAYARRLAAEGYNLVLHGRREELLAALCGELSDRHGINAEYILAELTVEEGIRKLEERLRGVEDLSMLINNAGTSTIRYFADEPVDGQEGLIRLHVLAAVRLTHAAIPLLQRRGEGAIINVSSVAAFVFGPGSVTYCSAKRYLVVFSEALHLELAGSGIRVQAFCPGFVTTDFHQRLGIDTSRARFPRFMAADRVVELALRALRKGKVVYVPGTVYRLVVLASSLVPRRLLYALALRYSRKNAHRREAALDRGNARANE